MAAIRFERVAKRFGEATIVHDLDLTIERKEFFTFVGPSGCGKSTLLNLIAGLEPITSGKLYFDDVLVNERPAGERDVAMVFQSYALYPHMSVFENIAFPLRVRRQEKTEVERKVREVAQLLGLQAMLARKPSQLSGGQRQRVALGRALVRQPVVFLLDEPLSNLDARLRLEMRAELKRLHGRYPVTTVYVTHDQEEAMVLSDRVAVLDRGRVQQCAPPQEVYDRPANLFVAGFIGSPPMNLLDGAQLRELPWVVSLLRRVRMDGAVVGVRPNEVLVGVEGDSGIEAKVTLLEPTGGEVWIDGEWNGLAVKGRLAEGARVKPGARAFFRIPVDKCHVFDKDSEKRVD